MGVQRFAAPSHAPSSVLGDSFARVKDPLHRPALRSAAAFCAGLSVAAVVAGSVRVLPWLLEPSVPLGVAIPFARGLAELAALEHPAGALLLEVRAVLDDQIDRQTVLSVDATCKICDF